MNLPRERKRDLIPFIQKYMDDELDHPIGELAAELLIDFMVETLAPAVYNQALRDAASAVQEHALDMEVRLAVMEPRN